MKLTLVKDYANYFNRNIKRDDYSTIIGNYTYKVIDKINFITGDDIRTSQVLNWSEEWDPNYLIVSEDGSTDIKSRWFIIDHNRTRKGQYILTLKRDLICENYDSIITSPAYIERGVLSNTSDPAVFNSENVSTNQIKQWERPIMETDINNNISPFNWIVGYCQPQTNTTAWPAESIDMEGDVETYATWNDFPYKDLFNTSSPTTNKDSKCNLNAFVRLNFVFDVYGSASDDKSGLGIYFSIPSLTGMYNTSAYNTPDGFTAISIADGSTDFRRVYLETAWPTSSYPHFDGVSRTSIVYPPVSNVLRNYGNSQASDISSLITSSISNIYTGTGYTDISNLVNSLNNKTVKIEGTVYKISIAKTSEILNIDSGTRVELSSSIRAGFTSALNTDSSTVFYNKLTSNTTSTLSGYIRVCYDTYSASMTPVSTPQMQIQLKGVGAGGSHFADITELNDAPYALFAIPYFNEWYTEGDLGYTYEIEAKDSSNTLLSRYKVNNQIAFASAQYISHQLQSGQFLIDLQLLPYCPLAFDIVTGTDANKALKINIKDVDMKNIINTSTNNVVCSIFFSHNPDRERNGVCFDGTSALSVNYNNINDLKVANQCDIYRLCSPSKSKYYDFNAAKNYGLNAFNICTTYKPFSPFIYVRPNKNINSLYGQNFNDYVGLIATGDYVLPTETDAWTQYQIQNKNYQQIFDRQIQHQTFLNNWAQKEQEYANKANIRNATIGGALSGGLTGAMTGAKVGGLGGPYGAIGGAIIGGLGGAFGLGGSSYDLVSEGAQLDMDRLIATNAENIAYAKDTFNYNLQNIQALPDTLVSTSSFDYINKVYPFIEYYTCTDIEKEQVRNLLTLQGMSVNKVATIDTLTIGNGTSYTKASLYKFIGDTSNPVIVNEINAELIKGVYL